MEETMHWQELTHALVADRDMTLHARVRWDEGDAGSIPFMGPYYRWGPGPRRTEFDDDGGLRPVTLEVWKHGRKIRVEIEGKPSYITDGTEAWDFSDDPSHPTHLTRAMASCGAAMDYAGEAQWLVLSPPAVHWMDDEIHPDGPIEETVIEGRTAWTVVISGIRAWFDQESLHVLALQLEGSTYREKLVTPEIGRPMDDNLFTWTDPVITAQERRERQAKKRADRQRERAERARQWFVDNVVEDETDLWGLPVTLDLTPTAVPRRNDATGEFRASGRNMALARALPGSDFRVEEHGDAHRWSAQGYNWQLDVGEDLTLGQEGIKEVWNQLHPDEEVTNYRAPGE